MCFVVCARFFCKGRGGGGGGEGVGGGGGGEGGLYREMLELISGFQNNKSSTETAKRAATAITCGT